MSIEISGFLMDFKKIMTNGRGLDIIPRPKNNQTMVLLGLTKQSIKEAILDLTAFDYIRGPEADRDKPGYIWVFGKQIAQREIYIKLKIAQVGSERVAKCISFHVAEYSLRYPNKRS